MKKIALLLIIAAVGIMASGDILAQRGGGGGGNRGGGNRGGGNRGGNVGRPGGGGASMNRAPRGNTRTGNSFSRSSITPYQGQQGVRSNTGRPSTGQRSPASVRHGDAAPISSQQRDAVQQWISRNSGENRSDIRPDSRSDGRSDRRSEYKPDHRPGKGPGSRYAYGHPYGHHRHDYHGWQPGWWTLPVAWGVGAAWWDWNTPDYAYYNPYAVYVQNSLYDYAEPVYLYTGEGTSDEGSLSSTETVAISDTDDSEIDSEVQLAVMQDFQTARDEFKSGDYPAAMQKIDRAINLMPKDAALHEFRGLVLFAEGKYDQAAGVVNSVLASGPGWNWDTMVRLYQDPEQYTKQLRDLEGFVHQHKNDAAAKFLLAYHYLVMGFTEDAQVQLKDVVQLQPKDVLSKRLLDMIEASKKSGENTLPTPPAPGE